MEASDHDERLRRLQRLAYGADTPPEERAAAEAELQAMSDAAASATASAVAPSTAAAAPDDSGSPASPGGVVAPARERDTSSTTMRWAIGAGVAALVVGIAMGVGISGLTAAPAGAGAPDATGADTQAEASTEPSVITGTGTPVELTPVYEVFEREQRPSDRVANDVLAGSNLDRTGTRLLVTRSDGAAVYAATLGGGADLCLVVVVPEIGAGSACTDQGVLPPEGLAVSFGFSDQGPPITASLHADGTAGLSAAEKPATE
ncbi:hypothetical protein [Agromyces lapidis]|uniref:DUF1707 domain-containing protein n=1 Tax=Agromyces lapidis TaxID=279574 RepID=A0ABV5SVG6_9MICO|nr:hypothetical protein [Agromyces lapidis]